jgi:hypothetical protein
MNMCVRFGAGARPAGHGRFATATPLNLTPKKFKRRGKGMPGYSYLDASQSLTYQKFPSACADKSEDNLCKTLCLQVKRALLEYPVLDVLMSAGGPPEMRNTPLLWVERQQRALKRYAPAYKR